MLLKSEPQATVVNGDGGPWGCWSDRKLQGSSGRSCHWTCFMVPLRGLASVFGDKEIATSLEGDSEAFAGRISGVDAFGDSAVMG